MLKEINFILFIYVYMCYVLFIIRELFGWSGKLSNINDYDVGT